MGWVAGHFDVDIDIVGIGRLELFVRLGLADRRLQGMVYARGDTGELAMPTELERPRPATP